MRYMIIAGMLAGMIFILIYSVLRQEAALPLKVQPFNELLLNATENGDTKALCHLGRAYCDGVGTAKDYDRSIECFTKAAEQGDTIAQHNLGIYYYNGFMVAQDYGKAVFWFTKATAQGDSPLSSYYLGECYKNGKGVARDDKKAFEFYERSADSGDFNAQYELARCYEDGRGIEKDTKKASYWYDKAGSQRWYLRGPIIMDTIEILTPYKNVILALILIICVGVIFLCFFFARRFDYLRTKIFFGIASVVLYLISLGAIDLIFFPNGHGNGFFFRLVAPSLAGIGAAGIVFILVSMADKHRHVHKDEIAE